MFKDRYDAGNMLADELLKYRDEDCIILGIPRGGAVIAKCVAERLNKPWDIIAPKKISLPLNREVAIGAVSEDGTYLLNKSIVGYYNISDEYIKGEIDVQLIEIRRRLKKYRGDAAFPDIEGRTVILVDDGIATGFTFLSAVNFIKKHNACKVIAAIPVAPVEAIDMIGKHVDEVICIAIPQIFSSVGESYFNFTQNSDDEIANLFKQQYEVRLV